MSKPKLYLNEISPASRAVLLTAKALNLDLQLIPVNTVGGEQFKSEFLKLNPQHIVPTLDDDGQILWESAAICTYLAMKYGTIDNTLCPNDVYLRGKLDQRLHFNNSTLLGRYLRLILPFFFAKETEIRAELIAGIVEALDFLEIFLENDDYLVGSSLTVADFCTVTTVRTIHTFIPADKVKYPKTFAWIDRIAQLPYYDDTKNCVAFHEAFMERMAQNKAEATVASN